MLTSLKINHKNAVLPIDPGSLWLIDRWRLPNPIVDQAHTWVSEDVQKLLGAQNRPPASSGYVHIRKFLERKLELPIWNQTRTQVRRAIWAQYQENMEK